MTRDSSTTVGVCLRDVEFASRHPSMSLERIRLSGVSPLAEVAILRCSTHRQILDPLRPRRLKPAAQGTGADPLREQHPQTADKLIWQT